MELTIPNDSGSLRVVAAFSVAALFVIVGWKYGINREVRVAHSFALADASFEPRDYLVEADSDSDGLPDWREALLGTDPNKPDSNGNGIPDKDEPPVTMAAALQSFVASSSDAATPLDKISGRLIGEYLNMKNRDAYSAERGTRLGEELASYVTYNTEFTPYGEDALTITPDTSKEALDAHRKKLQKALEPFLGLTMPEFVIYANYIESGDERALAELSSHAVMYQKAAIDMLAIPVPRDIAHEHLEVINALSFFATVLNHMVARSGDPIATLALLKTYNQSEQYVQATFSVLVAQYRAKLFMNTL